jgi:hypothetical protein
VIDGLSSKTLRDNLMSKREILKASTALASAALAAPMVEPLAVRIPEAARLSGFSRSQLYLMAGRGEIVFKKCGKTTLVDYPSLKARVAALPSADIRAG